MKLSNGPGRIWNRETIFVNKIVKNVGNFATVAVKFTSLNSKIAKYGSDLTNFENIIIINIILSIQHRRPFFCLITFVVKWKL